MTLQRSAAGLVRSGRRILELRARRVPAFAVGRQVAPPTIYYVAPDLDRPSGGIRVIYRHVDLLNDMGVPAQVMHTRPGFACTWFTHQTRVVAGRQVQLGSDDIVVVPEWFGPGLRSMPRGPRLVVFNQRAYDTFQCIRFETSTPGAPYAAIPGLVALLAVSRDNVDYLTYAFPELPVALTRNVVDQSVFHPAVPAVGRAPQIAYVASRRFDELEEVRHILRSRGVLDRWRMVPITGLSEMDTARVMRESALFLSLSDREGFGMPPAEAMASGCYVVGYPGLAGREFFDPAVCSPVPDGDLIALVRALEGACERFERDPRALSDLGCAASRQIGIAYSEAGLRDDLRSFYGRMGVC